MATYRPSTEIVTPVPRLKLIPGSFSANDGRIDLGQGKITMMEQGIIVDEADVPILDAEGNQQVVSTGRQLTIQIADTLGKTLNGITGLQVIEYIGTLFDELEATNV